MSKVDNYKEYWTKLAADAGIPQDKVAQIAEAFGDEAVAKVLKQGFKALPDYSYDLDQVRDKTKADAITEAKAFYDNWYETTAKPAHEEAQRLAADYKKYQELYGD